MFICYVLLRNSSIYKPDYPHQHPRLPLRLRVSQDSHLLLIFFPLEFLCSRLLLVDESPVYRQHSSGFKGHVSFIQSILIESLNNINETEKQSKLNLILHFRSLVPHQNNSQNCCPPHHSVVQVSVSRLSKSFYTKT